MRHANAQMHAEAYAYQQSQKAPKPPPLIPTHWTPGEVARRLVEAAEVLRRQRGRIGPKAYGSNWPDIQRDRDDVDPRDDAQRAADMEAASRRRSEIPSSEEISRMEEALQWPSAYLKREIEADAITFWATCAAHKLSITAKIEERADDEIRAQMAENVRRARKRKRVMIAVLAKVDAQIKTAKTPEEVAEIRALGRLEVDTACRNLTPIELNCNDPTRVMSKSTLYTYVNDVIDKISTILIARGVPFRPAPRDEEPDIRKRSIFEAA